MKIPFQINDIIMTMVTMFLIGLQDRSQVVSAHIKYHLIHHCIGGVHYTTLTASITSTTTM